MFGYSRCLGRKATSLSGVSLSDELRRRVKVEACKLSKAPCLAVVLVGARPDSLRYINHKRRAAEMCGIDFKLLQLPDTISQSALHSELAEVNNDPGVDGVLLQLPLPPHLRARPALFHIHPGKDVDGLHPLNAGNLFLQDQSPIRGIGKSINSSNNINGGSTSASTDGGDLPADTSILLATGGGGYSTMSRRSHERRFFIPCTALAVRTLLYSHLNHVGTLPGFRHCGGDGGALHAVIVNKSMVVGVPTAALLQKSGKFMVSTCSRGDNSLDEIRSLTRTADVLVTAYGQANVFDASFVKKGAIVIDVAINEAPIPATNGNNGSTAKTRLCGDIHMDSVVEVASAVTPTPGGVGPLTVAHLMQNVLKAAKFRHDNRLYYNSIYASFLQMYHTDVPAAAAKVFSAASGTATPAVSVPPPAWKAAEEIEDDIDNSSFDC